MDAIRSALRVAAGFLLVLTVGALQALVLLAGVSDIHIFHENMCREGAVP